MHLEELCHVFIVYYYEYSEREPLLLTLKEKNPPPPCFFLQLITWSWFSEVSFKVETGGLRVVTYIFNPRTQQPEEGRSIILSRSKDFVLPWHDPQWHCLPCTGTSHSEAVFLLTLLSPLLLVSPLSVCLPKLSLCLTSWSRAASSLRASVIFFQGPVS